MGETVVFFGKHSPAEAGTPVADDFPPSEFGVLRHLVKPGKERWGSLVRVWWSPWDIAGQQFYVRSKARQEQEARTVDLFFLLCGHWRALASSYRVDMGGLTAFSYSVDTGEARAFTSYH